MPLVSIDAIPEIDLDDINPSFHEYIKTDEDELNEEGCNKMIQEMLNDNPSLWTTLYSLDIIDSSMIPQEILAVQKDVPF